jgi:hypothetical protein
VTPLPSEVYSQWMTTLAENSRRSPWDGLVLLYGGTEETLPSPAQLVEWLVLRPNVDTRLSHSRSVSPRGFEWALGTSRVYPEMGGSMEIQNQKFFVFLLFGSAMSRFYCPCSRCLVQPRSPAAIPATHLQILVGLRLVLVIHRS